MEILWLPSENATHISTNFGFYPMLLRYLEEQGTPEESWNVIFRTSSLEGGLLDGCVFRVIIFR